MPRLAYVAATVALSGLLVALFSWQRGELLTLRRQVEVLASEVESLRAQQDSPRPTPAPGEAAAGTLRRPARHASAADPDGVAARAPEALGGEPKASRPSPRMPLPSAEQSLSGRREAVASVVAALESDDTSIRTRFRKLVREEQDAMWDERRARRQAAWEQRTAERLDALAVEADLSPEQVDGLFAAMTAARDRIGESFRKARKEGRFEDAHAQAARIREGVDAEARELLTTDQLEAYERMRQEQVEERRRRHRFRLARPSESGASESGSSESGSSESPE